MKWIWLGGVVVLLGTVLALLPNRQAVLVVRAAAEKVASGAAAQAIHAPLRTYEGND